MPRRQERSHPDRQPVDNFLRNGLPVDNLLTARAACGSLSRPGWALRFLGGALALQCGPRRFKAELGVLELSLAVLELSLGVLAEKNRLAEKNWSRNDRFFSVERQVSV